MTEARTELQTALADGHAARIALAAAALASLMDSEEAVQVYWRALDSIGPGGDVRIPREYVADKLFCLLARLNDMEGRWILCMRLILSEHSSERGWRMAWRTSKDTPPESRDGARRAFAWLEAFFESGQKTSWQHAEAMLLAQIRGTH